MTATGAERAESVGAIAPSWLEGFERLEREHPDPPGADWLSPVRRAGLERFAAAGFPTPRMEEWRKTNVAPIASVPFVPSFGAPDSSEARIAPQVRRELTALGVAAPFLVFLNGRYAADLSDSGGLPPGLAWMTLAEAARTQRELVAGHLGTAAGAISAFAAMNTAFFRDGAFVHLRPGAAVRTPLTIVFFTMGAARPLASHPRVLVVAGVGSSGRIVEIHVALSAAEPSAAPVFSNPLTEIVLEAGAVLDYDLIQPAADGQMRVGCLGARIRRSAALRARSVCLGGALVRNDVEAVLEAPGADCTLDGLFLARRGDHVDNHTLIDHAQPEATSRELYKGILASGGRAVFDGKIVVRPDARKTDAMQANRNLLLAEDAVIDTKPQLEILNNDVRCKHAATIGRLDETAVFYLRSRAIGEQEARRLLVEAFADEILSRLSSRPLAASLHVAVTTLLDRSDRSARLNSADGPAARSGGRP